MLGSIINFVKDHTYISIVIAALLFLFLYWLFFVDKSGKGTWNKTFHFPNKEPVGQRIRASGHSHAASSLASLRARSTRAHLDSSPSQLIARFSCFISVFATTSARCNSDNTDILSDGIMTAMTAPS